MKCYEVYEFGKKVKTLMQALRWAVRNRKLALFYEATIPKLKMQVIRGL